jgi:hypothetical protein
MSHSSNEPHKQKLTKGKTKRISRSNSAPSLLKRKGAEPDPRNTPIAPHPAKNVAEESSQQKAGKPQDTSPATHSHAELISQQKAGKPQDTSPVNRPRASSLPARKSTDGLANLQARQVDTLRELNDTVVSRLSTLPIQMEVLADKPGLLGFLNDTLQTDEDTQKLSQFLPEIAETSAMDFSKENLVYLYSQHDTLKGKSGLKEFLIKAINNGSDDRTVLDQFLAAIKDTAAVGFSTQQMEYLYSQRDTLQNKPGLKKFLIDALPTQSDVNQFLSEIKDTAATDFSKEQLDYLYRQRANVQNKPNLQEFLIKTLHTQSNIQELDQFLSEIKDTVAIDFSTKQLDYLNSRRTTLQGKPGLKEFLITTLATEGNETGLEPFLNTIEGKDATDFSAHQLGYLYELRADFNQIGTFQVAQSSPSSQTSVPQFVKMTVLEMAIARLKNQAVGSAKAEIDALRTFGYKERLYQVAKQQAAALGKKNLQKDLDAVSVREEQEISAIKARLKAEGVPDPGPKPTDVIKSGKEGRKAQTALATWNKNKTAYDTFLKNILPGKLASERQKIKPGFDQERANLIIEEQSGIYLAPELAKYQQFLAGTNFHDDAEWALNLTNGNLTQTQILFNACQNNSEMKQFGQWVVSQKFDDTRLGAILQLATTLNLNANKTKIVAPYLLDCTEQSTINWLTTHAATTGVDNLAVDVNLLSKHKPATQPLLIEAITLEPDRTKLTQYNPYLLHRDVGSGLLQLIRNRTAPTAPQNQDFDTSAVMAFFQKYKDKLDNLGAFLRVTNPRPTGYTTLGQLCNLVGTTVADDITSVVWSIQEAQRHGEGKGYIEHILTRLKEGRQKGEISSNNIGYKEWLLISTTWDSSTADNKGYTPGNMTGIFTFTQGPTTIEVHNHFGKDGGEQYSLHIKHGKGSFDRGPDLEPKKDKSVYNTISQLCLNAYIRWVNGRWAVYTLPST